MRARIQVLVRPQRILLLVSGGIKRVYSVSIYRYFRDATARVARSIAPATPATSPVSGFAKNRRNENGQYPELTKLPSRRMRRLQNY